MQAKRLYRRFTLTSILGCLLVLLTLVVTCKNRQSLKTDALSAYQLKMTGESSLSGLIDTNTTLMYADDSYTLNLLNQVAVITRNVLSADPSAVTTIDHQYLIGSYKKNRQFQEMVEQFNRCGLSKNPLARRLIIAAGNYFPSQNVINPVSGQHRKMLEQIDLSLEPPTISPQPIPASIIKKLTIQSILNLLEVQWATDYLLSTVVEPTCNILSEDYDFEQIDPSMINQIEKRCKLFKILVSKQNEASGIGQQSGFSPTYRQLSPRKIIEVLNKWVQELSHLAESEHQNILTTLEYNQLTSSSLGRLIYTPRMLEKVRQLIGPHNGPSEQIPGSFNLTDIRYGIVQAYAQINQRLAILMGGIKSIAPFVLYHPTAASHTLIQNPGLISVVCQEIKSITPTLGDHPVNVNTVELMDLNAIFVPENQGSHRGLAFVIQANIIRTIHQFFLHSNKRPGIINQLVGSPRFHEYPAAIFRDLKFGELAGNLSFAPTTLSLAQQNQAETYFNLQLDLLALRLNGSLSYLETDQIKNKIQSLLGPPNLTASPDQVSLLTQTRTILKQAEKQCKPDGKTML